MTCRTIDLGNGHTAIVCDRGRKPAKCTACKARPHTKLCDFPLVGRKAGATCSVKLCDQCAVSVGEDRDYCPPHAKVAERDPKPANMITSEGKDRASAAGELGPVATIKGIGQGHGCEALVRDWCADRFVDVAEVLAYWNERAGIREHDGGSPRWAAEELAFRVDVVERFGP